MRQHFKYAFSGSEYFDKMYISLSHIMTLVLLLMSTSVRNISEYAIQNKKKIVAFIFKIINNIKFTIID